MFICGSFTDLFTMSEGEVVLNEEALAALTWRNLGDQPSHGRMAVLAKTPEKSGLRAVLYDMPDGAPAEAFRPHRHPSGEVYFVLCGEVQTDPDGPVLTAGMFGAYGPDTTHTPTTRGYTVLLVIWTDGVELVD